MASMQTLLLLSPEGLTSNPGLLIGFGLLTAVAAQTGLALFQSARRLAQQRERFNLERERLQYEVKLAKSRWDLAEHEKASWNGWRKFRVLQKTYECEDVYSFVLQPHDGKPIPAFRPGQYLTFGLEIPGREKQLVRCYSLSSAPSDREYYRVTIKKEKAPPDRPDLPPGIGSSYFVDQVREGDLLNAKAPTGHFYLETERETPVVLISAGVGITPVLSMAREIAASGSKRETWFFFVCRNRADYMLKAEVEAMAARAENIRVHVCYSRPGPGDVKGRDFHAEGRLNADVLKAVLPSNNYDYYMCGNGSFMKSMYEGLIGWGVPEAKIHFEAFGPATIKKTSDTVTLKKNATGQVGKAVSVTFGKSGKVLAWDPAQLNLLDFARAHGVRIDSGCCAGSCGSCSVAIKEGEVEYLVQGGSTEAGSCLTCVCRPKSNLVLDA
jgi:ferredoxin-NADP reductase